MVARKHLPLAAAIKVIVLILFACLSLFLASAYAEPTVEIQRTYYTVEGKTVEELRRNLNKKSPVVVDNTKYDAYTEWKVSWLFHYSTQGKGCAITQVGSHVEISYIMPKVISALPPSVSQKWHKYYNALMKHEEGHSEFGIKAALSIEKVISALPPQPDCKLLEDAANAIGHQLIKKYITLEKQYDDATHHGATTGARFP